MGLFETVINLPPEAITTWGYLAIFLLGTFEATPFFGFLSPGLVAVAAGGFLAKLGILNIWAVLFWAALAAIIGDLASYLLGKKYGHSLITTFIKDHGKKFLIKEKHFDTTKKMMDDHAGKTLIIGRFNSVTRAFAAFVAGTTHLGFGKFMLYNVTGGVLWSLTYTILGYIFGEGYQAISQYVGAAALTLLLLLILGGLFYNWLKKIKE